MRCPYCSSTFDVPANDAQVVEEVSLEETIRRAVEKQTGVLSDTAVQVECATCGAAVVFEPPDVAGACPFCTSKIVTQAKSCDPLIAPQALLPFAVAKHAASQSVGRWLQSLWFAPDALKQIARPDHIEGVYLPYWTFDAEADTSYIGRRGEYYYTNETYTENVNGRTVTRTRSVRHTRWHPAFGRVHNSFDDLLITATKAVQPSMLSALEPWDLPELRAYEPAFLAGFKAQRYQVPLEDGFQLARRRAEPHIHSTIRADIGGDEQQILSADTHYSAVTFKHMLLPVWIGAYKFQSKVYQVCVNARTGEVNGDRPYSAAKITLFVIALLIGILILVTLARLSS
jgi:DNA-directed RNA polymerase subunit RPC12/RpoP